MVCFSFTTEPPVIIGAMSTADEFDKWLNNSEKSLTENLRFAINAWKSSELILPKKYEIVLSWLGKIWQHLNPQTCDLQTAEITEFFRLKCPIPGIIPINVKRQFVKSFIEFAKSWKSSSDRKIIELLKQLVENEMFQELYRSDYECYGKLMGQMFKCYTNYLQSKNNEKILQNYEKDLFMLIISSFKDYCKNTGNICEFRKSFNSYINEPLVELLITFQSKGMHFISHLAEIAKTLFENFEKLDILKCFEMFPLHVYLMTLECAIINFRGDLNFFQMFVESIFESLEHIKKSENSKLLLTIVSYSLEMFRKHEILLNFTVKSGDSALKYVGSKIRSYVEEFQSTHLYDVLRLLCATLRLNPLILETHIIEITTWMMIAEKNDIDQQNTYEDFLLILINMVRKVNKVQKFLNSLFKSLRATLKTQKLNENKSMRKKRHHSEVTSDDLIPNNKRIKLNSNGESVTNDNAMLERKNSFYYLSTLFDGIDKERKTKINVTHNSSLESFPHFLYVWPSRTVGAAFSQLIYGQTSKHSIVIWKMLIYELKEMIEQVSTLNPFPRQLDENTLYLLDFLSSLLCNYFSGCKLSEQSGLYWEEINENRILTQNVLQKFAEMLLLLEHNNRVMNAFLECIYLKTQFDLLLWYYRPDHIGDVETFTNNTKSIHNFISTDDWELIQQRIINFGKSECKYKMNRLLVQRHKAKTLFKQRRKLFSLQKLLVSPITSDLEQMKLLFADQNNIWLLANIENDEKIEICDAFLEEFDVEALKYLAKDIKSLDLIVIKLYQKLSKCFNDDQNHSTLASIDFAELKESEKKFEIVANAIERKVHETYSITNYKSKKIVRIFDVIKQLPIDSVSMECGSVPLILQIALYQDLKATKDEALIKQSLNILTDMLHFGRKFNEFKLFSTETLFKILPPSCAWEFYDIIFNSAKNEKKFVKNFFKEVLDLLRNRQTTLEFTDDDVKLLMSSVKTANQYFQCDKIFDETLNIFAVYVNGIFGDVKKCKLKKEKNLIGKTLPCFSIYIDAAIKKAISGTMEIEENLQNICKIYFQQTLLDHCNAHAIKFISIVLQHHVILDLDITKVEDVFDNWWKQVISDLRSNKMDDNIAISVIEIIMNFEVNDRLTTTLQEIRENILEGENSFSQIIHLLSLIAKCSFTVDKALIFRENFKLITLDMILRLHKDQGTQFINHEQILSLLSCQRSVCENKTITMSIDVINDIILFMTDINMKKFSIDDTNLKIFKSLHLTISDLMISLMKNHHIFVLDRLPQFTHIFKDLLQSVVWYKNNRENNAILLDEEINDLADLAIKLESLMHLIAEHDTAVKRVAPFVLCFVINLMVSDRRSATLYPKIKLHVENICYDLISICDHRVGSFILRCSNEAARQVYESLCRTYDEYHKFKGKV